MISESQFENSFPLHKKITEIDCERTEKEELKGFLNKMEELQG